MTASPPSADEILLKVQAQALDMAQDVMHKHPDDYEQCELCSQWVYNLFGYKLCRSCREAEHGDRQADADEAAEREAEHAEAYPYRE